MSLSPDIPGKRSRNVEMEQEIAKRLLLEGATIVLLGVPPGSEFGIDMKSWTTGEKFMGVKMIPPGIHMVYYSATNKHGDIAPRISFLHNFKGSEFIVRKWDPKLEELSQTGPNAEELERMKGNLMNYDRFLGSYPYDVWKKWKKLSDKITEELIERVTPESGVIRSALELVAVKRSDDEIKERRRSTRSKEEKEEDLLPDLRPVAGSEPRFTPIPVHSFPEGASPADITKHSMDQSYMLETMLNSLKTPCDLIGEIQFSFVCFLVGQSLESLEHWKRVVNVVCRSEAAIARYRELYVQLLVVVEEQLWHIPEDFLVDIVASNNVIYLALRELFLNMASGHDLEGRLRCEADRLKHRLSTKFLWDFDDLEREDGDDAPVVVELDE